jgi:hypothetical protein
LSCRIESLSNKTSRVAWEIPMRFLKHYDCSSLFLDIIIPSGNEDDEPPEEELPWV